MSVDAEVLRVDNLVRSRVVENGLVNHWEAVGGWVAVVDWEGRKEGNSRPSGGGERKEEGQWGVGEERG